MWDVIVVGGGHAGVEAAFAAARLGCSTLLITARTDALGLMPCNPAIGGLAKSHLVFELDALGGEMAVNTDLTGLQFRILNASRGPAVQATRVQCDKQQYARRLQRVAEQLPKLTLCADTVRDLAMDGPHRISGVVTQRNGIQHGKTVILTTGTALTGRIHVGHDIRDGGGDARPAADALSEGLKRADIPLKRLKTGTPPRIWAKTIDWTRIAPQWSDEPTPFFSSLVRKRREAGKMFHVEHAGTYPAQDPSSGHLAPPAECSTWNILDGYASHLPAQPNESHPPTGKKPASDCSTWNNRPDCAPWLPGSVALPCYFTHTNEQTHAIIRDNLERSALYGGKITGTGVRYCPSIEDKIVKFSDKDQHHVVIEPEGRDCPWVYPNGLSNSLPVDVQMAMTRSIAGLERAEFAAPGYAIEYDCIDARMLDHTLASQSIGNLYFAGQINGTTGYEEAAAQGLIAGINAACQVLQRDPLILSRQDAYIGVMIDDLVTKGTNEPYRMFTSRAERRLILRQDNARRRLFAHSERIGLLPTEQIEETRCFMQWLETEKTRLAATKIQGQSLEKLLSRQATRYLDLPETDFSGVTAEMIEAIEIETHYRGYIEQEERSAARARADEDLRIPEWLDYWQVGSLRYEAREKLAVVRPANLGQAGRIPGVNPADVAVLALVIKRGRGALPKV